MSTDIAASNSLAELAARIRAEHQGARVAIKREIEHAMAAGDLLIEAKAQVPHGQWLPWLKEHCDLAERTAQAYMRLARNREAVEAKSATVADLTVQEAIAALASPSGEAHPSQGPHNRDDANASESDANASVEAASPLASSSVNSASTRDLPTPSCAVPEADTDPRAAALAEGKRLADKVRASSIRLLLAVERYLTGCRDYGKQVNEMSKRERAEFLKGMPVRERKTIRHWCAWANDEHAFRIAVRTAQLDTDEITWGRA